MVLIAKMPFHWFTEAHTPQGITQNKDGRCFDGFQPIHATPGCWPQLGLRIWDLISSRRSCDLLFACTFMHVHSKI